MWQSNHNCYLSFWQRLFSPTSSLLRTNFNQRSFFYEKDHVAFPGTQDNFHVRIIHAELIKCEFAFRCRVITISHHGRLTISRHHLTECYAESSATAFPSPLSHYFNQPLSGQQSISFPYEILFRNWLVSDLIAVSVSIQM